MLFGFLDLKRHTRTNIIHMLQDKTPRSLFTLLIFFRLFSWHCSTCKFCFYRSHIWSLNHLHKLMVGFGVCAGVVVLGKQYELSKNLETTKPTSALDEQTDPYEAHHLVWNFTKFLWKTKKKWCADKTFLLCHFLTKSCFVPQLCGKYYGLIRCEMEHDYLDCGWRTSAFPGPWSAVVLLVIYHVNLKLSFPILGGWWFSSIMTSRRSMVLQSFYLLKPQSTKATLKN